MGMGPLCYSCYFCVSFIFFIVKDCFHLFTIYLFYPHPRTFFKIAFRERGREREKHGWREKLLAVHSDQVSYTPLDMGDNPASWACALTKTEPQTLS